MAVTKTSMTKTGITETGITKTGITKTVSSNQRSGTQSRGVVDEGSGGRQNSGGTSQDGGVSLTPLSVSSIGSGNKGKMGGLGLSNLGGINRGNQRLRVEGRGNKRLGVEGRGNEGCRVEGGGNRESGVLNTESKSVSNIANSLELIVSINIRVSTVDTGITVSNLVLGRQQVAVTVVQVSEFILKIDNEIVI
jgi:hypothetical protein